jgi:putative salt-induced outer membrane protein YdiY
MLSVRVLPVAASDDDSTKVTTPPADSNSHLVATAELSYSDASGNTNLALLGSRIGLKRLSPGSELSTIVGMRYGKQDGDVAAENYAAEVNARFRPMEWVSPFFYAKGYRDLITNIDLRVAAAAGADLNFVPDPKQQVSIGVAVLRDYERRLIPMDSDDPREVTSTRFNLRLVANPTLKKGITAEHTTQFEPVANDFSNYLFTSRTALRVLLTGSLALQTSYQFSFDATPAPGVASKTDRALTTGLIVEIK